MQSSFQSLRFFLFLFFLCIQFFVEAQQDFIIQNLKLEKGLSQSTVWAFTQDRKGFVWVGTQDGLNRYDGYKYRVFKHIPFDTSSLSSNFIGALYAEKNNKIWVGSSLEGLDLFNPQTQKCLHFGTNIKKRKINSNDIRSLLVDKSGSIWVGTSKGINRIMPENDSEEKFIIQSWQGLNNTTPGQFVVNKIIEDNTGRVWVGTRSGLFYFEKNDKKDLKLLQADTNRIVINGIAQDYTGKIWVATQSGLFWFNEETHKLTPFGEDILGTNNPIDAITTDSYKILWIASPAISSYLVGLRINKLPYSREWVTPKGYSLDNVGKILLLEESKAQKGVLWIGTYSDGLLKMSLSDSRFISHNLSDIPEAETRHVSTIFKDGNNLWIGTDKGLILRDETTGKSRLIRKMDGKPYNPPLDVRSVHKDGSGNLWVIATRGTFRIHNKGNHISLSPFRISECEEPNPIYCYEDSEHNVYFSNGRGINVYNPYTQKMMECSIIPDSILGKNTRIRIFALLRDVKNRFWIGTSAGVLLIRDFRNPESDLKEKKCIHLQHNATDSTSLRSNTILSIHEDSKGNIWFGTTDGLIMVTDNGKKISFKNYSESEGLISGTIYGILEDNKKNHLWLSTNGGIFRFHLITKTFENYVEDDGLQSNEFNGGAYHLSTQNDENELFFGGIRGYTRFFPARIKADTITPYISITDIIIKDNKPYDLLYEKNKKITLDYSENTFIVNFLGIQYIKTENLHYFYALQKNTTAKPQKLEWIYLGKNHQVNFSNLSPGRYTFYVTGSTNRIDDYKNGTIDNLEIEIYPPFWQTAWFYLLLIVALGTLLWLLHQYRVQQNIYRVMDMERVRKNAAADFHDELGHKLTVISLFANVVKSRLAPEQKDLTTYLEKVVDTSNSLYLSMKDLLWVLDPKKDSIYDLALMLKDFGDQLFDKSGVDFMVEGFPESMKPYNLQMYQKRHIALMFKEVMNNTMKHSKCKSAFLSFEWNEEKHHLIIHFKDNGIGFDPNDTLSGNGLLNLTDRANKIGGNLEIHSEKGKGTEVILDITFSQFSDTNGNLFHRIKDYLEGKTHINGKAITFFKKDKNSEKEFEKI